MSIARVESRTLAKLDSLVYTSCTKQPTSLHIVRQTDYVQKTMFPALSPKHREHSRRRID